MHKYIQTLSFSLTLIGCLLHSACSTGQNDLIAAAERMEQELRSTHSTEQDGETTIKTTESGGKVRTTIKNSWNQQAKATINKVYNGAWEFHEIEAGDSIVVRLYRNDFLIGTYDGSSYYEIAFQIPSNARSGQEILLSSIPLDRPAVKQGEYNRLAHMKDGEITAFKYGNPRMGWMKESTIAKVKIISIRDTVAVIHFRLKADLDPIWNFDIDKQFTLRMTSQKEREQAAPSNR